MDQPVQQRTGPGQSIAYHVTPPRRRCAAGRHHQAVKPPSTLSSCPVTYDEARDARNTSGPLRSSGLRHPAERHPRAVLRLELFVLPGQDAAGRQRVHADAAAGPVRRKELRQVDDAGLRRAIGRRLDERRVARQVIVEDAGSGDTDAYSDPMLMIDPLAARRHARAEHLGHLERAQQVHFDHPAELIDRELVQGVTIAGAVRRLIDPGVVDEDERLAELGDDALGRGLDGRAVRDVAVDAAERVAGARRDRRRTPADGPARRAGRAPPRGRRPRAAPPPRPAPASRRRR